MKVGLQFVHIADRDRLGEGSSGHVLFTAKNGLVRSPKDIKILE